MGGCVRFERLKQGARVTLEHTARFNAMTRAMWRELREGFVALAAQFDLRWVLPRGRAGTAAMSPSTPARIVQATLAPRLNKRALHALRGGANAAMLADAAETYAWADSHEHREGVTAFLEKRKPDFSVS